MKYHEEIHFPFTKYSLSIGTADDFSQIPEEPLVGFVGRSNSGKSSLLNAITNQKGLAKVSKSPGKTKLVNLFTTKQGFHLVDLPGFGYSKASHREHKSMMELLDRFLNQVQNLKVLFILIDAQREFPAEEVSMIETCQKKKIRPVVVRTKADKLNQREKIHIVRDAEEIMNHIGIPFPYFLCSSTNGKGINEIRKFIFDSLGISQVKQER
ncbi:probable GTP-binding protein EngB [Leptospira ryugenii]|uniref:Probable GTP-binding protein EngB n=1 Tax=Leptospira ryugenii TaxID=1917863 RepID=A0A2P2E006_9LEPT|nr:ribosome biogenesis GTP-binding protein YihA/YsxC [Leptospira ryugenii]GBF50218.1 probable GTP-binding protein EngB [Leptospira ryugenii]